MRRALAVLTAATWLAGAMPAAASDVGTRDDVRVVRGDAQVLLARRVRAAGIDPKTIVVDRVVAQNGTASVQWHAGALGGTEQFARIYRRWWNRVSSPESPDGFLTSFAWAHADADVDAAVGPRLGRRPTEAESWLSYPGGNSYFFFSAIVRSSVVVHVTAGSALDVWFPFVLDPSYRYSLTIAHADPVVGPVDGTLRDNTLHFVLPAFALVPGTQLMGEIEGDPH